MRLCVLRFENSQDLTAFVKESKFSHLIESQSVRNLSKVPEAEEALLAVDITAALGLDAKEEEDEAEKKPTEKKEPEPPADPNAPKPGSARIF